MNAKQMIKLATSNGWELKSQSGSHMKFTKNGKVSIVPYHGTKDLPTGTLNSVLKQLGLK